MYKSQLQKNTIVKNLLTVSLCDLTMDNKGIGISSFSHLCSMVSEKILQVFFGAYMCNFVPIDFNDSTLSLKTHKTSLKMHGRQKNAHKNAPQCRYKGVNLSYYGFKTDKATTLFYLSLKEHFMLSPNKQFQLYPLAIMIMQQMSVFQLGSYQPHPLTQKSQRSSPCILSRVYLLKIKWSSIDQKVNTFQLAKPY